MVGREDPLEALRGLAEFALPPMPALFTSRVTPRGEPAAARCVRKAAA